MGSNDEHVNSDCCPGGLLCLYGYCNRTAVSYHWFFRFSDFRCLDKAVYGDFGLSYVKGLISLGEVQRHVRVSVFKF